MKKNKLGVSNPSGWGNAYVVMPTTLDSILGKLLTTIEVIGLPEKQEVSIKSLIRQALWEDIKDPIVVTISSERHTAIRLLANKERVNSIGGNIPAGLI